MTADYSEAFISSIIAMAWSDDVSFDVIKRNSGVTESEVIAIMRKHLKPRSFVVWRKRVTGRKSKHEKKEQLFLSGSEA